MVEDNLVPYSFEFNNGSTVEHMGITSAQSVEVNENDVTFKYRMDISNTRDTVQIKVMCKREETKVINYTIDGGSYTVFVN